jgi:hypothetical protein
MPCHVIGLHQHHSSSPGGESRLDLILQRDDTNQAVSDLISSDMADIDIHGEHKSFRPFRGNYAKKLPICTILVMPVFGDAPGVSL